MSLRFELDLVDLSCPLSRVRCLPPCVLSLTTISPQFMLLALLQQAARL